MKISIDPILKTIIKKKNLKYIYDIKCKWFTTVNGFFIYMCLL